MAGFKNFKATIYLLLLACCCGASGLELSLGCWDLPLSELDAGSYVASGGVASDAPVSEDCSQLCADFDLLYAGMCASPYIQFAFMRSFH